MGISLTRFLIRGFPDPVTESLVFWKLVYTHNNDFLKNLALKVGNPCLATISIDSFKKLIEDPSGLNIQGSANPNTMIKEEIKNDLIQGSEHIRNNIMKSALQYLKYNEEQIFDYMRSVHPLFPRFISEYLSATYLGIVQSLVGLFQNSKTIRTLCTKRINIMIIKSEIQTVESIMKINERNSSDKIWECSSTKADNL